MNKGIIIGAEHESTVVATLPFVTFRHATSVRQWLAVSGEHPFFDRRYSHICSYITSYASIWQLAKYKRRSPSRPTTSTWFSSPTLSRFSFTRSSNQKQLERTRRRTTRTASCRQSSSF